MKTRLIISLLLAGLFATPATAHEDGVYESLGHIPIGRIFLSPEERARLDKVRGKAPAQSAGLKPGSEARARATNKDAAGFIISDSGRTRVWKNGDFVAAASASDVRFPGQVRVASESAPRDGAANEHDEDAEPAVGVGDEPE